MHTFVAQFLSDTHDARLQCHIFQKFSSATLQIHIFPPSKCTSGADSPGGSLLYHPLLPKTVIKNDYSLNIILISVAIRVILITFPPSEVLHPLAAAAGVKRKRRTHVSIIMAPKCEELVHFS